MTHHVTQTPVPASMLAAPRDSASPAVGALRCQAVIKLGASPITDNQPRAPGRAASCRTHTLCLLSSSKASASAARGSVLGLGPRDARMHSAPGSPWSLDGGIVFEEKITRRDPSRGQGRAGASLAGRARSSEGAASDAVSVR